MKNPELIKQAIRQLPNLKAVEEQLESAPSAVLDTAFPPAVGPLRSRAIVRPAGATETVETTDTLVEVDVAVGEARERLVDAGKRAVRKVRKDGTKAVLQPEEERGLEAIILLMGRPAILIQDGRFFPPPDEWRILETHRSKIEKTLGSVGRVDVTGHPAGMNWIGTAFLVAKDVIMTNRHVAKEFCRMKNAKQWEFEPGMKARIDYKEELGGTQSAEFDFKSILGVHEVYDLALFKVSAKTSSGSKLPAPLPIASQFSPAKKGRKVYLIGYPASDSRRNDPDEMRRIFSNIYDVKRLQPGEIMEVASQKALLAHDCSTLGGNSGSCVVDLETHQVIGLHFSGSYLQLNHAVALWKLTKDPLLKKAAVNFG
ncbi:MAG: trypsin-like serine peptidase [Acidobacteriota bacterium]